MKAIWTAGVPHDLYTIRLHLHPFNPVAARKIAQAPLLAGDSLPLFPPRGRIGLEPSTRELVAAQSYIPIY